MSLDLWLESPGCPHCGDVKISEHFNYTYNCSPMWYQIYPEDESMIFIDGMSGEESLAKLRYAMDQFLIDPNNFIQLNPKNGWGCFETFKGYIYTLIREAKEHPTWIWQSSR